MSLRLYLDDCAYSRRLRQLLCEAGHDVETPADLVPPLLGADDATHFAHAQAAGRTILTLNARDFQALHDQNAAHAGILVIYQDNDPSKDMRYADIVRAIANARSNGSSTLAVAALGAMTAPLRADRFRPFLSPGCDPPASAG